MTEAQFAFDNELFHVFVDMDGTLSDDRWRRAAIPNWEEYHSGSTEDLPNEATAEAVRRLACVSALHILTGRPENRRGATEQWLEKHAIRYDFLIMRGAEDFSKNQELKLKAIESADLPPERVLVIDNNVKVADLLRSKGYTVWLVE